MQLTMSHGLLEFTQSDKTDPKQFFKNGRKIENQTRLIFEIEKVKCFEIEDTLKFTQLCYLQGNSP